MNYNRFLKATREALEPILDGFRLMRRETPIPFIGLAEENWFKSDLWIELGNRPFIVEIDDNSNPAHSIAKCWPYIDYLWSVEKPNEPPAYIGIWRQGKTTSYGYFELAKFIGRKMMEQYPGFTCHFHEWTNETPEQVAQLIKRILTSLNIFAIRTQIME